MISSAVSFRAALREPQPPAPPTGHESPRDAQDAGWLGQVPPASPGSTPRRTASTIGDTPPVTGHESARDARDAGWLGQVPPSAPAPAASREPLAATHMVDQPELGAETPHELRDRGWLGQVPPPAAPTGAADPVAPTTTYANPQLAPEPWKDSGSLFTDDPTLFG